MPSSGCRAESQGVFRLRCKGRLSDRTAHPKRVCPCAFLADVVDRSRPSRHHLRHSRPDQTRYDALGGGAKSYGERLFTFPRIGELGHADAVKALVIPAEERGVAYETAAVQHMVGYAEGYPYFLQEYGSIVWDYSAASPITLADALAAQPLVEEKLDESFFRVRIERATQLERQYMKATAECGSGAHTGGRGGGETRKDGPASGANKGAADRKGLAVAPSMAQRRLRRHNSIAICCALPHHNCVASGPVGSPGAPVFGCGRRG